MNQESYLKRIAAARLQQPATTSQEAYVQVDRMAKSTNGRFMTKASEDLSVGPKKQDASSKESNR